MAWRWQWAAVIFVELAIERLLVRGEWMAPGPVPSVSALQERIDDRAQAKPLAQQAVDRRMSVVRDGRWSQRLRRDPRGMQSVRGDVVRRHVSHRSSPAGPSWSPLVARRPCG